MMKDILVPKFARSRLGLFQLLINFIVAGTVLIAGVVVTKGGFNAANPEVAGATFLCLLVVISTGAQALQIALDRYTPESVLDAKRFNEQLKLLASAINTIAAAAVTGIAFAQIVKDPGSPNIPLIVGAAGLGVWVQMGARGLLLHLKDEAVPPAQAQKPVSERHLKRRQQKG